MDDALIGAWRLRSFEFTDAAGGILRPLGEHPAGYVILSGDGHMSLNFTATDRADFAVDDLFGGSDEERAAAARGFVSFGGPYRIEGDAVVVEVEFSLLPNWVGRPQTRRFAIDGDRLTLRTTGPKRFGGMARTGEAVLVRASSGRDT